MTRRVPGALAAAFGVIALAAPGEAGAVTVEVTDTTLIYTAAPRELNRVSVSEDEGLFYVYDSSDLADGAAAPVTARPPCRVLNPPAASASFRLRAGAARALHPVPTVVDCPLRPEVRAELGDHDDGFSVEPALSVPVRLDAGAGDDAISTAAGPDVLIGADGDDQLGGGRGPDRVDGGPGVDAARYDYDDRREGVTVTLAGGGDDGGPEDAGAGGRDALVGLEDAWGTAFADTLVGDGGANELIGGDGADRLVAGAGADDLSGGVGRDRLHAGRGGDRIDSRDGAPDRILCDSGRAGRGDDAVSGDARDRAAADCDTVSIARATVFGETLEVGPRATVTRGGAVLLRLSCLSTIPCGGRLSVATATGDRLGGRAFAIPAEGSRTLAVRARGRARRRLQTTRAALLVARVVSGDPDRRVRTTRRLIARRAGPAAR